MSKEEDDDDPQLLADQLEQRLIDFAVRIIKLSNRLPKLQQENTFRVRF